jgi:ParB-like chromosome segregation protein Spo0J
MKIEKLKIAELSLDPANARKHSPKNIETIKASLRKFGQQKPIVVDAKGIVIAGNGTLTAAQELGWTDIQATVSQLTGIDKVAFGIADNRSSELAEWDQQVLATLLKEIPITDSDLLSACGFSESEHEKLVVDLTGKEINNLAEEWSGMPEFTQEDKTSFRSIIIHFASQEKVDDFAKLIDQSITDKTISLWHPAQVRMETEAKRY